MTQLELRATPPAPPPPPTLEQRFTTFHAENPHVFASLVVLARRAKAAGKRVGMNALWDNGPIAILAMADYFSKLGKGCLPRTLQFVFTTGHLYQHLVAPDRDGSAEQLCFRLLVYQGSIAFGFNTKQKATKLFCQKEI